MWADNNPSQKALAKELYRLGYTITLNGDIIPRAEEEKAMKSYIEYQKSQVIEKAVEWVKENYADFCREINYRDNLNECFDVQNFTEELRKEMEE